MRRVSMVAAVIVLALVVGGAGFYYALNPERHVLDDAARAGAPGKFIQLSDGVTHYDQAGPDDGDAVLLIHGFSVPYYIWDSTAYALSSEGYRVIRYDEYGRGLSDRPNVEYTDDLFDRQITELLDSLMIERLDVGGVSMGGAIATMYTLRHPDRVRSLILVDPVAGASSTSQGMFDWPLVGPYLWQTLAVPKMADGQASDFANPDRFPDWANRYREQVQYRGFGHALLSHRQQRAGMTMDSVYQRVGKSGAPPVLLLWGTQDQTVPFPLSAGVRQAIPTAEFHAIDGAAHLPILEKAQLSDSLILAFLGRRPQQ